MVTSYKPYMKAQATSRIIRKAEWRYQWYIKTMMLYMLKPKMEEEKDKKNAKTLHKTNYFPNDYQIICWKHDS